MRVRVKLFAYLRETLGFKDEQIEVEEGTQVAKLWETFRDKMPRKANFRVLFVVNGQYVEGKKQLKEGDEIVFIPPVSGG
ncbi:MAG: MoaD/ThiS family protein [Thermodesulfobacteriota bacterium]